MVCVLDERVHDGVLDVQIRERLPEYVSEQGLHRASAPNRPHEGTVTDILHARLLLVHLLELHVALRVRLHVRQRRRERETPGARRVRDEEPQGMQERMERRVRAGRQVSGREVEERLDVAGDRLLAPEADGLCLGLLEVLLVVLAGARAHGGLERLLLGVCPRQRPAVRGAPGVGLLDEDEREGDVRVLGRVQCVVVERVSQGLEGWEGFCEAQRGRGFAV